MNQAKGTTGVWLSPYSSKGPEDLNSETNIQTLMYAEAMPNDYTKVGEAELVITFFERDVVVSAKVESLRAELQTVRAEAQIKALQLEGKIQQLLAIGNEVDEEQPCS